MIRALRRVRSVTARRQLRWIVWGTALGSLPFVFGYVLPFVTGLQPPRGFELSALLIGLIPLAFASAIVRYRLMDVEVIIKRGLVYAAAVMAIAAIYSILLKLASAVFLKDADQRNPVIALLATLVVVLLSRPVKDAIQSALDRRLLPRSLRLSPRARRLRARPQQRSRPAAPERAPGPPRHRDAARGPHGAHARSGVGCVRRRGLRDDRARRLPRCAAASDTHVRRRHAPDFGPHARARRRLRAAPPGCARGRALARGRDPLLRSVRLERRHDCGDGTRTQGERGTAQQRRHGAPVGGGRAGGDGARERPALSSAAHEGGRGRADAAVQREHPGVVERRARRARPERPGRALEPPAGRALRRASRRRRRPRARSAVRRAGRRDVPRQRASSRRKARPTTACR